MKAMCAEYGVPFVINDDLQMGSQIRCWRAFRAKVMASCRSCRTPAKEMRAIGRTCLNSIELAEKAIAESATYVAFGAIYSTETKPEAGNIGLADFKRSQSQIECADLCYWWLNS